MKAKKTPEPARRAARPEPPGKAGATAGEGQAKPAVTRPPEGQDSSRETVVLHFKAAISRSARGTFTAAADEFPGIVAQGDTEEEAHSSLQAAILKSLAASSAVALEPVYEEPLGFIPYALLSHRERLWAATNLDVVLVSETGNPESWKRIPVTQQQSDYFQVFEGPDAPEDILDPGEYLSQVYCLAAYKTPEGREGIYAGTNMKGLVYAMEGSEDWRPAFSTGEERVHSLASFAGALFAGTSSRGRIYRWNGGEAELVHQSREFGITALVRHKDAIYAGTYPEGMILRSEDGEAWESVLRTGQRFVNQLFTSGDALYAACSHPAGGAIYRTNDGQIWEKCFASERDANVFAMALFGGRLYAGTGDAGRLYSSRDGVRWEVTAVSSEAALRTIAVHRGRMFLGCEQRGMLYRTSSTEAPPPRISDVHVTSLSSAVAMVEWGTDTPCDAILQYGVGQTRDQTVTNPTLSKRHRFKLDGLKAGTRYTYLIRARNENGAQGVYLGEEGFVTQVLPPPSLEVPSHPQEDRWYSSRQVRLAWEAVPGASRYLVRFARTRVSQLSADDQQVKELKFTGSVPADGAWWFAVAAVDDAGNVGDLTVRSVRVDTSAQVPAAACLSHPDPVGWYNLPVVEVEAQGVDEHSGVEGFLYSVGRAGESWEHLAFQRSPAPRWKLPRLPDGEWDVFVRLRDNAGNESPPAALRLRIDTAPPEVTLDPPPKLMRAGEVELHWKVKDDRSGIAKVMLQQKREGTEWETVYEGAGASARVRGEDGWKAWYRVVAEDKAGMRAIAETPGPVLFDGSPPAPVTTLEAKSMPGGDVMLKWVPVTDALSGVARYHVYRSSEEGVLGMKAGSVPSSLTEWTDDGTGLAHGGKYFYRVTAEDALGNAQTEGVTRGAICDKEAATPVLRSPTHDPEKWTEVTDAVVEWDEPSDDTGITEYLWRLDRNSSSTLTRGVDTPVKERTLKLSRLMDGLWYVHVSAVDGAGNVSPPGHYPIRIATKVVAARLAPLPQLWNKHKVQLTWEADEGVSAVSIGLREGGAPDWTVLVERAEGGRKEVEVPRDGLFEFSVRPQDSYGRQGVWSEGQVVLIDTVPPLEIPQVGAAPGPAGSVRVEWDASWDELSGLASYRVYRSRSRESRGDLVRESPATADCTLVDQCEGAEEGTKFFYRVWPVDAAGNVMEQGPVAEAVCDRSIEPPRLSSRSHPDPNRAVASRKLELGWEAVDRHSGVAGVVVELGASPASVPNPDILPLRTDRALSFDLPEDGKWFVHARALDNAGNISEPAHLQFMVDTRCDPPFASFPQDPFMEWRQTGKVTVVIKAPEDLSGITGFWYAMDRAKDTVPAPKASIRFAGDTLKLAPSEEGMWFVHVAAEDAAGNVSIPVHLTMRLSSGLPIPRIISCSHPEGLWSHERELTMEWEKVEGDRVSYLYWVERTRSETPPASASRVNEPHCRVTIDEGDWFLHVCAADDLGRRSDPAAYQVRVDGTAPEISLYCASHPKGEWSSKRKLQYAVEAEDAHSGVAHIELALTAGGTEPGEWELALGNEGERDVPGEGVWTLWARAFDQAGNVSKPVFWNLQLDLGAPAPVINSPSHPVGQWSSNPKVEVFLQSGGDLSGVAAYSLAVFGPGEEVPLLPPDGAIRWTDESAAVTVPGEGRWVVAAWSEDLAGNMSPPSRYQLAVDRTASSPAGFVVEPTGEGGWIRSREVRVSWRPGEEVSGEPAGYLWVLDNWTETVPDEKKGSFTPFPELEFAEMTDGGWYLHVRAVDEAGNLSDAVHLKLLIDATPPTLSLRCREAEAGGWLHSRQVTIETGTEDGESGVRGCFFTMHRAGGEAPAILQGSWREEPAWAVEIPGDGEWVVNVEAMDGAGNLSEPTSVTVRVDLEAAPPLEVHSTTHPDPARWYKSHDVRVEWREPPDQSGVAGFRWSLTDSARDLGDRSEWQSVEGNSLDVRLPTDGAWLIGVCTEDRAGNLSDAAICEVRADSVAPVPRLSVPSHPDPEIWYAETDAEVVCEAEDTASGIAELLLGAAEEGDASPPELEAAPGPRTKLALGTGAWTIRAVAVDGAGNRSEPAEYIVHIDATVHPPLVACESHPDADKWYQGTSLRFSIVPATKEPRKLWWLLDHEPVTRPTRDTAKPTDPGRLDVTAPGPGEWFLHVVTETKNRSLDTEAVHVRVRVDNQPPPPPVLRSPTHPSGPRRSQARDLVVEWDEPEDLSGVADYTYGLFRSGVMGMRKEKGGTITERTVKFDGLAPGTWDLTLAARDGAGNLGTPARFPVSISETQDLCVMVRSESWRVVQVGMEVELRQDDKPLKRARTGANGEAWFKDLPYGTYSVVVGMGKLNTPLEFDHVKLEEGEAHVQFDVSLAGAAWTICRDFLRMWVQRMWVEGGRVEILNEKEARVAVHHFMALAKAETYLECPLPRNLLNGHFQMMGGALNKLQWAPTKFTRLPL